MTIRRQSDAYERRRHVSLPPVLSRAADALADREGRQFSNLIQELIRVRAEETFGPEWPEIFSDEERGKAA